MKIIYEKFNEISELNGLSDKELLLTATNEVSTERTIHIWPTDPTNVIQSIINSANGIYESKYMARKLQFMEISTKEANNFLDKTHLHGHCNANRAFALVAKKDYFHTEILQVVTFGKNRFTRVGPKKMELLRMATKLNTQVVGGFSKLIKDSMKAMEITELESFVDRRIFDGSGYNSSGWKVVGTSQPAYHYYDPKTNILYNRQVFMKQSCLKKWPECDSSMTEHEMCLAHGLYRVYDRGNIKLLFTLEEK